MVSNRLFGAFFLLNAGLIIIGFTWFWKDYYREWRWQEFQFVREVDDWIAETSKTATDPMLQKRLKKIKDEMATFEYGEKQIYLPAIERADRCQSCHLGADIPELPFKTGPFVSHPQPYTQKHEISKYGCTLCHNGQGRASTKVDAHGDIPHWVSPMLTGQNAQAGCGKCHFEPLIKGAPNLTAGRNLFYQAGCFGCHKAEHHLKDREIAPSLRLIADKVRPNWLAFWLTGPKKYLPDTLMPDYGLSEPGPKEQEELADLMSFLETIGKPPEEAAPQKPPRESVQKGEALVKESQCLTCHTIDGFKREGVEPVERIGPDITRVGLKAYRPWIVAWIKYPQQYLPRTRMSHFRFTDDEAEAITNYLESLSAGEKLKTPKVGKGDPAKGKKVVEKYGCFGCHDIPGFEAAQGIGPDLSDIGRRGTDLLDYAKLPVEKKSLVDWLTKKITQPRVFDPTQLKMPNFRFNDQEIKNLVTFVLSFTQETIPPDYLPPKKTVSTYEPTGEFGRLVKDLNCQTCHTIFGKGGAVAPDLTGEGSRVQREWAAGFLANPHLIRPLLQARMPNFRLADTEIATIVDYFNMVLVDDRVKVGRFPEGPKGAGFGRVLFTQQYGCPACHELNGAGGRIGPALDRAGARLEADWLFTWLANPQAIIPDVQMPSFDLNDRVDESLTAYVTSLKPKQ